MEKNLRMLEGWLTKFGRVCGALRSKFRISFSLLLSQHMSIRYSMRTINTRLWFKIAIAPKVEINGCAGSCGLDYAGFDDGEQIR